jgi:hypothetical protein
MSMSRLAALVACGLALAGVPAIRAADAPAGPLEVRQTPERGEPGSPVRLTIVVVNTSAQVLEPVGLMAEFTPVCGIAWSSVPLRSANAAPAWDLGKLGPGEQKVVQVQLALPADLPSPAITSKVTASYPTTVTSTASVPVPRPEMVLEVTAPELAPVGEPVAVLFTVRNRGNAPQQGVSLQIQLPDGLGHPGGNDLENDIGTVPAGETRQVKLDLTPARAGELSGKVRLVAAGAEPLEKRVALRGQEVKLAASARGPSVLYPNWPAVYELTVTNEGTEPVAGVRPVIHLPKGLAFVRASEAKVYDPAAHALQWSPGDLAPGAKRTVFFYGVALQTGEQSVQTIVQVGGKANKQQTCATQVVAPPAAGTE